MVETVPNPRTWSLVGRNDAFVRWREVVCQAFTRLSPERVDDGPFAGDIRMTTLGDGGSLSRIAASAQTVSRRREDVSASPCEAVFVNIQVAGTSVVRQREIETCLGPGAFVLLDARQPFAMRFVGPFRQLCLHLPVAWLHERGFDPGLAVGRRVDRRQVYGAALMDQVDAVRDGMATEDIAEHLIQMLSLCYAEGRGETLADKHLALVRRFVANNSTDSTLAPGRVAAHFRISVRYLHRLFARSGETFGSFLLRSRIHRSRQALLLHPDRSIIEIATEAGFRNPSHFSRSFREQYGIAPSQLRQTGVKSSSTLSEADITTA